MYEYLLQLACLSCAWLSTPSPLNIYFPEILKCLFLNYEKICLPSFKKVLRYTCRERVNFFQQIRYAVRCLFFGRCDLPTYFSPKYHSGTKQTCYIKYMHFFLFISCVISMETTCPQFYHRTWRHTTKNIKSQSWKKEASDWSDN